MAWSRPERGGRVEADVNRREPVFAFGRNWRRFLAHLNEERVRDAEASLRVMLDRADLDGASFLDIGSGSGLFSLAARRLGARVRSLDVDPESVACTRELRARFFPDDPGWVVEQGSALDRPYIERLGRFDIVYSWGVLHHTGDMWRALDNAAGPVAQGGQLFIAIYNDQGLLSRYWSAVKRLYNRNAAARWILLGLHAPYYVALRALVRRLRGAAAPERGMTLWYDLKDWLGGYPFEVATPAKVVDFHRDRGFVLTRIRTCGGRHGCNEFVFRRTGGDVP
jgi:2-polyprenyl-6-hydroxyphenyl methylase/3-demethylubiquinone-9 3-methyltransferase